MSRVKLAVAVGLLGAVMAASAVAIAGGGKHAGTRLSGFEEVPAIVTEGNGKLKLRIDRSDQTIDYRLSYDELEGGAVLAAHIHVGQFAVNGAVAAFLCGGADKPACPPSGTVEDTIDANDIAASAAVQGVENFDDLVTAIKHGVAYANVHTTRWTGGEIRGQIESNGRKRGNGHKGDHDRGHDDDND
jgi:CHRD domain